jgi:hypothetical protein
LAVKIRLLPIIFTKIDFKFIWKLALDIFKPDLPDKMKISTQSENHFKFQVTTPTMGNFQRFLPFKPAIQI